MNVGDFITLSIDRSNVRVFYFPIHVLELPNILHNVAIIKLCSLGIVLHVTFEPWRYDNDCWSPRAGGSAIFIA